MRARILTSVDDGDGFAARVIEVEDEQVLLRVPRGTDPQRRALVSGGQVQLLLGGRDSAHLFHATVLSRLEDGIIVVLLRGHPLRLQRREYFRLAVRLPIAVCLPIALRLDREDTVGESEAGDRESDEDDEPMFSGSKPGPAGVSTQEAENSDAVGAVEPLPTVPEIRIFRLADLSGGGCLCLDPEDLLRPGRVYAASLDLRDGEPALHVSVEVVRRGISFGYPTAGLRFVTLAEKHRERIMRTLFREHQRRVGTARI
jgi:c-di-GMP-binding flagellar brake protein YcgR